MKEKTLIIGLGNPGKGYAETYHNTGVLFIDYFEAHQGTFPPFKVHQSKLFCYTSHGGLILAKSLVFMNESGDAVGTAAHYFKINPSHLYVAHDESDLSLGEHKIEAGRGAAGHRGVLSVVERLGENKFNRIRIGIRDENVSKERREKAAEFVLRKISGENKKKMEDSFRNAAAALSDTLLSAN